MEESIEIVSAPPSIILPKPSATSIDVTFIEDSQPPFPNVRFVPHRRKSIFYEFYHKCSHYIWSLFVETFYIPAYRWEWGNYREWSYETYGRPRNYLKLLKSRENKRKRKEFIRKLRNVVEGGNITKKDKHEGCRRVRINCSGTIFETQARTLAKFSNTLLGNPERRMRYWDPETNEYFFDRHPECFECILHYYQSGGERFERPYRIGMKEFRQEIVFFELKGKLVDDILEEDFEVDDVDFKSPENFFKRKLWLLLEHPNSSAQARLFSYISISAIILSTIIYCMDTMVQFSGGYSKYTHIVDIRDPIYLTESVCVAFFSLEFLTRLYACRDKIEFLMGFSNIVDFFSLPPFTLEIVVHLIQNQNNPSTLNDINYIEFQPGTLLESVYRLFKLIRVFRILKLSRYFLGLRILGQTFLASLHELGLLAFFLLVGVILYSSALFFVEGYFNPKSGFVSIPGTFYWAVSTMTTTGFDTNEELPKTAAGKIIGSLCAVAGVLTLSLPVPVVVANFTYFYHRGTAKTKKLKPKTYTRSCPYKPTCKENHGELGENKVLAHASKVEIRNWRKNTIFAKPIGGKKKIPKIPISTAVQKSSVVPPAAAKRKN